MTHGSNSPARADVELQDDETRSGERDETDAREYEVWRDMAEAQAHALLFPARLDPLEP